MSDVWFGRDIRLDRQIAVKFVRFPSDEPDDDYVRRFVRESRITARLEHPGVPAVYDAGSHEGRPYLVMQRIHGSSLGALISEHGPLSIGWVAAVAAQVCAVLSAAHRASLIHRDLKPNNLMLEPDGTVKVLDFGLAVAPTMSDFSKITMTGQLLGTPSYMAPERIQANISGPAGDIYSLGCTIHELLTGERPFTGATAFEVLNRQVQDEPPGVRTVRRDVPEALEALVLEMLRKKPEERPVDADAVYDRLLPFATDLGPVLSAAMAPPGPSSVRRYAAVVSRIHAPGRHAARSPAAQPDKASPIAPTLTLTRVDLERARTEATELFGQSRYDQAAELLTRVLAAADGIPGLDDEMLTLRSQQAEAWYEDGDYRRAGLAYERLVGDLSARQGSRSEVVLTCRLRAATCHALTGETRRALRELETLVRDETEVFGAIDPRTVQIRRQFGLLQLGSGDPRAAEHTLAELTADLTRAHGTGDTVATEILDLMTTLRLNHAGRSPER
ncbi:protein kinase [Micromonospora tulbaghiae]|uniref:serine/threonine-protein kinase n=1 Tax=Micromonospora tulbaghiae TaxID=479978 RepID=UPI0033DD71DE